MISEGSCDTDDWSNDAENYILKHITIENSYFKLSTNKSYPLQTFKWVYFFFFKYIFHF